MAEIYLVRHGQASLGADNYDQLSPLGLQQARWLGNYFEQRELHFDHVIAGSLQRQLQTVAGIAAGINQPLPTTEQLVDLNEFDFQQICQRYSQQHPEQAAADANDARSYFRLLKKALYAWSASQLEGFLDENWQQFCDRVARVLQHIQQQHHGKKVLVVSSGGVIANITAQVLQAPASAVIELNLQTKNTGLSELFFNRNTLRLSSFNNTPHLDQHGRRQHISFA